MGTRITDTMTRKKTCDFLVRGYPLDGRHHFYLKVELADPAYETLVPWCQADEMYPERHPRVEVKSGYIATRGFCLGCSVAYELAQQAVGSQP
jgi:hypothetical protein